MADLVAVGVLWEDFSLYPRDKVSPTNVRVLRDALNLGAKFPPVIAWRTNRAIIDGLHRVRAIRTEKGDYGEVAVEWRDYDSKGEAFADALRLNGSHGLRLAPDDYQHIMERARHFGLKQTQISGVLKVPVQRLQKAAPTSAGAGGGSLRQPRADVACLKNITRHDATMQGAIGGLGERLQRGEMAPGELPRVMADVKRARDGRNHAALRGALLDGAALFLWWAARLDLIAEAA